MQRIKNYLKSECSSTTKSSENQFRIKKKKKQQKTTLDPMNAKIDLVTFNYVKKKYFGLLTLLFMAIATDRTTT